MFYTPNSTVPEQGVYKPAINLTNVDFPEPFSATISIVSPCFIVRFMPCTTAYWLSDI
ncbi:hypothetical protein TPE_0809 [Treponema pedis str. T A4]|uniref:Uncharacterized protein n=1 Tax=Treponema pedis str. T A4 TaxID=1291379 RepID=S5ZT58_9SPIR|nr:hypothetical protein TPE_0809 [Treponema pedis str. T A4]